MESAAKGAQAMGMKGFGGPRMFGVGGCGPGRKEKPLLRTSLHSTFRRRNLNPGVFERPGSKSNPGG
jgi:hypothetical protein